MTEIDMREERELKRDLRIEEIIIELDAEKSYLEIQKQFSFCVLLIRK